jgi:GntR family transcriptional regulator, rspAB operon transcriptional repressor
LTFQAKLADQLQSNSEINPAMLSRTKLDRRRPMRDQIYPVIRDMILTGTIAPGAAIDEKAIAQKLQISRTPVREAVKRLSDEHLVDVVAQSGTRAARINLREIEQAYLIRLSLEVECASQAAPRMTPLLDQHLLDIQAQHEKAIAQKNFVDAIAIDDNFHRTIAFAAELPRLWHMIEISKAHLDRCRHMLVHRTGEAAITLEQHRTIVAALKARDAGKARAAMQKHLEESYRKIAVLLKDDEA